jgi:hypothetical protein
MVKSTILSAVPYDEVVEIARVLLQAGLSREQVAQEIAGWLDARIDFRAKIKGVIGEIAEGLDGPVFYGLALAIANLVTKHAEG